MKRRAPAPWLFAILNVPHAVVTGGVTGTLLSFLLRQQGVAPHAFRRSPPARSYRFRGRRCGDNRASPNSALRKPQLSNESPISFAPRCARLPFIILMQRPP